MDTKEGVVTRLLIMDIPDELRNLDFETYDAISALVVPEKKGEIISITALIEEEVTKAIAGDTEPSKTLLKKSLSDKIKSLESRFGGIEGHEQEKKEVLAFLRALLEIRNLGAHSYGVGFADLAQLEEDHPGTKHLLSECPKNLWAAVKLFNSNMLSIKT